MILRLLTRLRGQRVTRHTLRHTRHQIEDLALLVFDVVIFLILFAIGFAIGQHVF